MDMDLTIDSQIKLAKIYNQSILEDDKIDILVRLGDNYNVCCRYLIIWPSRNVWPLCHKIQELLFRKI
jgi:hypothetical protein